MNNKENILREKALQKFSEWRKDWNMFARDVFGSLLDKEQQEIITSVQFNRMTSVASGTARGKDYVTAVASMCFMYLTPKWDSKGDLIGNTKVALTAPTGRQVENIMQPEFSRLFNQANKRGVTLPGRLVSNDIRTKWDEWYLTAFKADDHQHENWSGFHAVNTMFAVTEASGIAEGTFEAIEGNLQGNSRLIIVFNPNKLTGYAARSQKSTRWNKFSLNSLNATNVVEKKMIIPGQVDYEWVKDKVETWCTPVRKDEFNETEDDFEWEGSFYRPDDTFRKKVLGKFPKVDEDSLIPMQWIEMAVDRFKKAKVHEYNSIPSKHGVDVAGMGRDKTVFAERKDNLLLPFYSINSGGKAEHMKISGLTANKIRMNPKTIAMVDTIGEGAGVYSRLVEMGFEKQAFSCKWSEKPERNGKPLTDLTGEYQFMNLRAYCFWAVRDWLDPKNGQNAMMPYDEEFIEEATEIKWFFQSNGKIAIEKKEDIKERIGRSIDKFDATALTFGPFEMQKKQNLSTLFR